MIIHSAYTEVSAAAGTWTCPVALPASPFDQVRSVLSALARNTGWPVAAFAYGDAGEPVTELLLYRDPSRTFGTPPLAECDAAVRALIEATGWTAAPQRAPADGVLVGLGLREGYELDAPQHEPGKVIERLAEHGGDWECRTARLVAARLVNDVDGIEGRVRWYDEVGAVVHAPAKLLPVIAGLAHTLKQDRFVVTHLPERTYALSRRPEAAHPPDVQCVCACGPSCAGRRRNGLVLSLALRRSEGGRCLRT